jgi:ACS family tartrate transporter-like MFS transporter
MPLQPAFPDPTPVNAAQIPQNSTVDDNELSPREQGETLRLITRRLVPFLFFLYVIAYLDRVNVGFAKTEIKNALHFSDGVYGMGAGIFFIGYFLFEVPSNILLERFGARLWIARIMFTWGVVSSLMMFIHNQWWFYGLRFLLGFAEAGFFPGVILYLTFWFTRAERARIIAQFMTANMVALIFGSPISAQLLKVHGGGLQGWQWLFLLEGLPAVFIAFVVLAYLPNGPADARWLAPRQRKWLTERLRNEDRVHARHDLTLFQSLADPRVAHMSALYLALVIGMYGFTFWLPTLIKSFDGVYLKQAGWITPLPYIVTAFGMVAIGAHSERHRERRLHVVYSALLGSAGLAAGAFLVHTPVLCLIALAVAATGMWGTLGPFWGLSTSFLAGTAAAGAIALINSVGNLGGFVGPYVIGFFEPSKIGFTPGLLFLATSMFIAALLAVGTRKE